MEKFKLHTQSSAPEKSKALLAASEKAFGMLPNLHAVMAESPELLDGYQKLHQLFLDSSFNAEEKTVVWQTINVAHNCHYCVPAHTAIAKSMGVDDDINQAVRDKRPLADAKLEVLRQTTLAMVENRGQLDHATAKAFFDAGFSKQHLLEIVLGLSQKVMSNYVNHLAETPVDEPFAKFK